MKTKQVNIIDDLIYAVSLLNNVEEYINGLDEELSNLDKLRSDYEHIIENEDLDKLNLKKLFTAMKENYLARRKIKQDKSLGVYFQNNNGKLNLSSNREMLIQGIKNTKDKLETTYNNRILTEEQFKEILEPTKKKPGRPKKVKAEV